MPVQTPEALLPLYEEGLLDEVIRPLMSGKEASVFLVRSRGMECVAKVYKDAQHRTFRQRAAYAEGRQVRRSRQRRALQKGSAYGKSLLEATWQNAEVDALLRLHEAGVRVPTPYHHAENVLLMELVTDANGDPAPRLDDVDLDVETATLLHEILIRDIVAMLCAGLVHGDLSQYNILVAADGPVIIDVPQATDAATNRNSEAIFLRDVKNVTRFLGRAAPALLKTQYGPEIWDLYARAELRPDSELTGRFRAKKKRVDAADVIAELRDVEAEQRPPSAYQLKKQRQAEARAAEARAAPGRGERGRDDREERGGGRERQERDGGRSGNRRDGGRERQERGGGRERQERGGGPARDQRDGGRARAQRDGGPTRDQRDGGPTHDQRGGERARDRRDGRRARDQRDGGRARDQRDDGRPG
ncbi:MAG: PA4780 family RIO1-like protein kinase, partial [Deltaproteobacteria bacterium]